MTQYRPAPYRPEDLIDRLIIVDAGKIVADGPKEEVLSALKQGQIRTASG